LVVREQAAYEKERGIGMEGGQALTNPSEKRGKGSGDKERRYVGRDGSEATGAVEENSAGKEEDGRWRKKPNYVNSSAEEG